MSPGPIRDFLRDHILERDAVSPMARLLREAVGGRRRHSVSSLRKSLGLPLHEVHRRLVRLGLMPPGFVPADNPPLTFPAEETAQLCLDINGSMTLAEAARALACTTDQARALHEAGLMTSLVDHGSNGSAQREVFAMRTIDDLLARLANLSREVETAPGALDIQATATRRSVSFGCVVSMILDGRIRGLRRLAVRSGLPAFRLLAEDVSVPGASP